MAITIQGMSPNGVAERKIEIAPIPNVQGDALVRLWIHSPNSSTNGWEVHVSLDDLMNALEEIRSTASGR